MGSIYLIRHGQASFGQNDYDNLSALGVEQSAMLGQHFKSTGLTFDTVYTGAMKRHQQTATACLGAMETANNLVTLDDFNEYDHEHVFHVHKPEFKDKAILAQYLASQPSPKNAFQKIFAEALERWISGEHNDDYPESWAQFKVRCKQGLETVFANAKASQNIAVFTSGGPISSNVQQHLDVPDANVQILNWSMVNCSVTHFLYNSSGINLNYYNNYSHLQASINSPHVTYR
jgi:broad specificity phosphatase PhoE